MNTTAAQIASLNASVSTEVLMEAIQRLAAKATRTAAENHAFASAVAEMAQRDERFAAWLKVTL